MSASKDIASAIAELKTAFPNAQHAERGFRYNWECNDAKAFIKHASTFPDKITRFSVQHDGTSLVVYYNTDAPFDPLVGVIGL